METLITRYGNDSIELKQARQIEYQKKLDDVQCCNRKGILDVVHMAEHLFSELDKIDCCLPDSYKRNFIMLNIKDTDPEIYTSVAQDTDMNYHQTAVTVKKLAALSGAIDKTEKGTKIPIRSFFSKTKKETKGEYTRNSKFTKKWYPEHNQCFWCLEMGHRCVEPGTF